MSDRMIERLRRARPARSFRLGVLLACVSLAMAPGLAQAANAGSSPTSARIPPVFEQLASPFTESELGSIGCLTANAVTGGLMVYFMGGFGPLAASLRGSLPPVRVLEGAAAASFVFSSACYIGQALAPLMFLAGTALWDRLVPVGIDE